MSSLYHFLEYFLNPRRVGFGHVDFKLDLWHRAHDELFIGNFLEMVDLLFELGEHCYACRIRQDGNIHRGVLKGRGNFGPGDRDQYPVIVGTKFREQDFANDVAQQGIYFFNAFRHD